MDALREQRKQHAHYLFMKEGAIGAGYFTAGALAAHFIGERVSTTYRSVNWRGKLFAITSATVAGFAIRSEQAVLEQKAAESAWDEARQSHFDDARRGVALPR
jgi:hypothetical protein